MDSYLTSTEAARLLKVTPSSIKRWTQSGQLRCVVTPGRHRRFARRELEDFARRHRDPLGDGSAPRNALVEALLSDQPLIAIQAAILELRSRERSWYETAEVLGAVPPEIGSCWASGGITILDEHRASERFARALSTCAETIATSTHSPTALIATAEGDEHTLALNLVELCLREAGWNVIWGGRATPLEELAERVERGGIGLVGLSASAYSSRGKALAAQVRRLAPACKRNGTHLVLGGSGAWPANASEEDHVHRIERFAQLHELLVGSLV